MSRLLAFFLVAFLSLGSGAALAQAGYVHDLTGTATATAAGGAARNLKIGDTVDAGTTVATGEKSSAVIKFEDGQVMALAANSSFRVVDYRYNKNNVGQSSAAFALLRGGLRFISGVIGSTNHDNVRITGGSVTIGLRGTDGSLALIGQVVTAAVNAGAIVMTTQQGSRTIGKGQFASASPNEAPTVPAPTPEAAAVVRLVLDVLAAIQNLPINTPVVVQVSARAAAAQAEARELAARAAAQPNNPDLQRAAQEAALQAQTALANAINAAVQAYQDATKNGAVAPEPPAPPPPPPLPGAPGDSGPTSTGTTTSPTGAAGSGGGGGGTSTCGTTSTSPC